MSETTDQTSRADPRPLRGARRRGHGPRRRPVAAGRPAVAAAARPSRRRTRSPAASTTSARPATSPTSAVLASLGCGNPTALADLQPGETVLDLGSGGGIDVLLSAKRVGPTGKAYGLDMTDEMLALARENQQEAGVDQRRVPQGRDRGHPAAGRVAST